MLASELDPWIARVAAFLFGAVWGSFFNVAIHRWPRDMSVVTPPSHCPACKTPIKPGRNVPILSWLFLRGRAPCCGAKISPRYVIIELSSALLAVALVEQFLVGAPAATSLSGAALESLVWFVFLGALLIGAFADLETGLIPDEVTLPGAAVGLVSFALRSLPGAEDAALGAGLGFLIVQVPFVWSYERLTGRRGMGEGDAKLLMMVGAFVGWHGVIFSLAAGALQGVLAMIVVAVHARATGRPAPDAPLAEPEDPEEAEEDEDEDGGDEDDDDDDGEPPPEYWGHRKVRFGPFLALGALEFLFFGDVVLEWYASLF